LCTGVDEYAGLITRQRRYAEHPNVEEEFRDLAEKAIKGEAPTSEKGLRKLTKKFPDFWEAYLFLGIAQRRQEKWEQARDTLEKLRKENELPGIDKELTGIYSKLNQPGKALECAKRAMESAPEDPTLITNYAAALLENDKLDEALKYARRAEMYIPDDAATKKLNELIRMRMEKRGLIRNMGAIFKEAIGEATRVWRRKKKD
jgi:tetratricopeptide (TPR) repeat protein